MKKILTILTFFALFACNFEKGENLPQFHKSSPVQFVEGSQDIPLAKGLSKINDDENLDFDSFGGSILSVAYKNETQTQEVKDFYIKTLPQLGWKVVKANQFTSLDTIDFVRDKEKLEIEFVTENDVKMVRFFVESLGK